jgi:xylulokinase
VKAVAADADGKVAASARVAHALHVRDAESLEHDVDEAWRDGVARAYAEVSRDVGVVAVNVAAMVPSLGALNADGSAAGPGLLYGDHRGRRPGDANKGANPAESGELLGFLRWLRANCPGAECFWPAQATANHVLCGRAALDTTTAFTAYPLFDGARWDPALSARAGVEPSQLPEIVAGVEPAGRIGGGDGPLLGGGTIDAMGEQLVAGADEPGDVLVICGTTLITWAVMGDEWIEKPGLWTIPHTAPKRLLIGGPSNAGGLFLNWACALAGNGGDDGAVDPNDVPVWLPYVRGERTPLRRHDLRASLHGLNLTHGPAHVRRAAYEAAGFVVRHHLDLAGDAIAPRRIVATGGGTRVDPWLDALASCTGLPVDVVAVPEGAALGSAFIARCVAGLEAHMSDGSRWARVARRIEPDDRWAAAAKVRYEQFRALTRLEAGAAEVGDVM